VTGPYTVESLSPHRVLSSEQRLMQTFTYRMDGQGPTL